MEWILILFLWASDNGSGVHHIGGFKDEASCDLAIIQIKKSIRLPLIKSVCVRLK